MNHRDKGRNTKNPASPILLPSSDFKQLFEAGPDPCLVLDPNFFIVAVNDAYLRATMTKREEIIGHGIFEIFPDNPDEPGATGVSNLTASLNRVLQDGVADVMVVQKYDIRKPEEEGGGFEERYWSPMNTPVYSTENKISYIIHRVQDVTEFVKLRLLSALVESSCQPIIAITKDMGGIIKTWNIGAERVFGYKHEEAIGRNIDLLVPPGYQNDTPAILQRIEDGEHVTEYETVRLKKDNTLIHVLLNISPIKDLDGIIIGASISGVDISERKRAEKEIVRLNNDLSVRAAELKAVNKELETFNYTVAHDLRQPLNTISLSCQAIELMCGDLLNEECRGYIRNIYNSNLHMNQLIDDLLTFSRVCHVDPRRQKINLCALAQGVVTMLQQTEPERQVDFRIADGIEANGDVRLLRVVLNNLLGNAWKYTAMQEKAVIEFGVIKIDGVPTYFVRDNGVGFDKANANNLFAPFQRLPGTENINGFGIGLATVERIIKRHGGKIWAEGEKGKGATFFFTLTAN